LETPGVMVHPGVMGEPVLLVHVPPPGDAVAV
jgi:hypothetical protein